MRRLAAGVCVAKDSFVAANCITLGFFMNQSNELSENRKNHGAACARRIGQRIKATANGSFLVASLETRLGLTLGAELT
jgi:hypothetical protein